MTYKQIEASREARLWITQVVVPALGIGAALIATVPEIKDAALTKFVEVKDKIKFKFHK